MPDNPIGNEGQQAMRRSAWEGKERKTREGRDVIRQTRDTKRERERDNERGSEINSGQKSCGRAERHGEG